MWRFLAKSAISVLLIWLLVRNRDLGAILHRMLGVERLPLLAAAATMVAMTVPGALRWSAILGRLGHPTGLRITFPVTYIGMFFNATLPSSIGGDAVRMWLANRYGVPTRTAITSVAIDRLTAFGALLLLVAAALPVILRLFAAEEARIGVVALLAVGVGGFGLAMVLDRAPNALLRPKPVRAVAQFAAELRAVLLHPGSALVVTALSLTTQAGLAVTVWLLAIGLDIPISLLQCLIVVPLAILVTVVPISIAGWGVREGAFVAGFGALGVAAADAFELSVLFGLIAALISLPGGLVWLILGGRRKALRPGAERKSAASPGGIGTP